MVESRKARKSEIDIVAAGGNTSRHFYLCREALPKPLLSYMILS
jgi:hypothetical protein